MIEANTSQMESMERPVIAVKELYAGYPSRPPVLRGISFSLDAGAFLSIAGENGSGKSTLLKALCGLIHKSHGEVFVMGRSIVKYTARELSRIISYVPQFKDIPFHFTVRNLIELGSYPLGESALSKKRIIEEAIELTGVGHILERQIQTLSGGELQRAHIAVAIAQGTPIIILDEPSTHLDMRAQKHIYDLFLDLSKNGKTIIVAEHNINLVSLYARRLLFLKGGQIFGDGCPKDIITTETIKMVYGSGIALVYPHDSEEPIVYVRRN